jgi:membrane protease YdiL (CAAX protease family)
MRLRSGSLLAPVLLHLATNSLGTLAAVAARRLQ